MECTAARLGGNFSGKMGPSQALVWLNGLVSSVGGWLLHETIVLWCSPGSRRCSTLLPLDNSWLAISSAVAVVTTDGETLSAQDDRWLLMLFCCTGWGWCFPPCLSRSYVFHQISYPVRCLRAG